MKSFCKVLCLLLTLVATTISAMHNSPGQQMHLSAFFALWDKILATYPNNSDEMQVYELNSFDSILSQISSTDLFNLSLSLHQNNEQQYVSQEFPVFSQELPDTYIPRSKDYCKLKIKKELLSQLLATVHSVEFLGKDLHGPITKKFKLDYCRKMVEESNFCKNFEVTNSIMYELGKRYAFICFLESKGISEKSCRETKNLALAVRTSHEDFMRGILDAGSECFGEYSSLRLMSPYSNLSRVFIEQIALYSLSFARLEGLLRDKSFAKELDAEIKNHGFLIDFTSLDNHELLLHRAIHLNSKEAACSLINQMPPDRLSVTNKNGWSPLALAIKLHFWDVVCMILDRVPNSDLIDKNPEGNTPFEALIEIGRQRLASHKKVRRSASF